MLVTTSQLIGPFWQGPLERECCLTPMACTGGVSCFLGCGGGKAWAKAVSDQAEAGGRRLRDSELQEMCLMPLLLSLLQVHRC